MTDAAAPGATPIEVSLDDFTATDFHAPLIECDPLDCMEASSAYRKAAIGAAKMGNPIGERVFNLLSDITSFHFKPSEESEPFGPISRMAGRRSAQPSDFKGQSAILAQQIDRIGHLGVRTRVADVAWLLDKKQANAGVVAITGYAAIVEAITYGTVPLQLGDVANYRHEVPDYLRRAVQIGKAIGWDKEPTLKARQLISELRVDAAQQGEVNSFRRLAKLDLDYRISPPCDIASEAEQLAGTQKGQSQNALFHIAARAHGHAKKQEDRERCVMAAAETLVTEADNNKFSAMQEIHWLEKAIAELRQIPSAKARTKELRHRLVEVQSGIIDEMVTFKHSEDASEAVAGVREAMSGLCLADALEAFARISTAPSVKELEDEALEAINQSPLASIIGSTTYRTGGMPVHRTDGGGLFTPEGNAKAIQSKIAFNEQFRRGYVASILVEFARQKILEEHALDEPVLLAIVRNSPFVPNGREGLFARGLLHFFQGDMIAAVHILLPQLENSLRHILRQRGHEVIKINEDMTQEELGLTQLLSRLRPELEGILGAGMIADIENVLVYRGGPQLRDRLAHGQVSQWEPYGEDAVYACWLIYQLCCIPLLKHWSEVKRLLES